MQTFFLGVFCRSVDVRYTHTHTRILYLFHLFSQWSQLLKKIPLSKKDLIIAHNFEGLPPKKPVENKEFNGLLSIWGISWAQQIKFTLCLYERQGGGMEIFIRWCPGCPWLPALTWCLSWWGNHWNDGCGGWRSEGEQGSVRYLGTGAAAGLSPVWPNREHGDGALRVVGPGLCQHSWATSLVPGCCREAEPGKTEELESSFLLGWLDWNWPPICRSSQDYRHLRNPKLALASKGR